MATRRTGAAGARPETTVWHDLASHPAARSLARDGVVLSEQAGRFRLAVFRRDVAGLACERILSEAATPEALTPPCRPSPRIAFVGERRDLLLAPLGGEGAIALELRDGRLREVGRERPCARLRLTGDPKAASALALDLARTVELSPTDATLAEQALDEAGGSRAASEPCPIDPDTRVDDALAGILAAPARALHRHAADAARGDPVAIHQMRVATRRWRSAALLFRDPLGGSLDALLLPVARLAGTLGEARDWDVFSAGTCAAVAAGIGPDRRIAALAACAGRNRAAAIGRLAARLGSRSTRRLLLHLTLLPALRPWQRDGADFAALDARLADAAPRMLERRHRSVVRGVDRLDALDPEALHDRRKSAKKLRYAIEFLAPAWPGSGRVKRTLRRLARVQDRLGTINDAETGAALIRRMPASEAGGEFAAGAVLGFLAAGSASARFALDDDWSAFRATKRFWRHG